MSDYPETVRRYYALVDDNDTDGLLALFSPDAEYRRPGYEPLVGRERIEEFYRSERVIADGRHAIEELVSAGGTAAVRGSFSGTLRDGAPVEAGFADFFRFAPDGRFAGRTTYFYAPLV
jgi:steroid Delta-isomerase